MTLPKISSLFIFVLVLVSTMGCSSVAKTGKVGECIKHDYEDGVYKIVKTEDKRIIAELQTKSIDEQKMLEISWLYGGWKTIDCPKDIKMPFK